MMKIDPVERHLFLEGVFLKYGYDFRQYAEASLNRRLGAILNRYNTESLLDVLKIAMESPTAFKNILPLLTINTTEFFRDPGFFKLLRSEVFPVLKTYPKVSIWVAGCSSGEEVLSLSIALKEEGLSSRTTVHATDINPEVIKAAREGIYPIAGIQQFNRNYTQAGGTQSPSEYYATDYGLVRFHRDLFENVVFSEHNLATDAVFTEAHLIICRNVLIYFSRELQNRALDLFARSLAFKGYLGLGSKESLRFSSVAPYFTPIHVSQRIYSLKTQVLTVPRPKWSVQ
jgi:chemotaxis protein methyltransferase CheR